MIEMTRAAAKKAIREAVMARLVAEVHQGDPDAVPEPIPPGRLHMVEGVHWGERIRSIPDLPAIFIVRESETVVQSQLHESRDMQLSLVAMVADDDPVVGLDLAEEIADEAVTIVTAHPKNLGLGHVNYVKAVRNVPVSPAHTERRRVASIGVVDITYTIRPI